MEKYIVSSCLAGINCRYDGKSKENEIINKLIEEGRAIPMCPEQLGGLPTPRVPSECKIVNGQLKVFSKNGEDVTEKFNRGAEQVLVFAKKHNIKKAILKQKSPSCGTRTYDGSFTGTLADYSGITAKLLMENGIEIISSDELVNLKL